jgi:hypothetical protein
MGLSAEQLQTLSTHIAASPDLSAQAPGSDGDDAIARLLNLVASPAWVVWRTSVTWDEIMLNGMDWARVDNLSVGKSRIWDWMFQNSARAFNPSKTNIRAGIDAVWVGTAADLAVRAAVYVHCKRNATRAEKLYTTGTGTTNDPAALTFEGDVTLDDVQQARAL